MTSVGQRLCSLQGPRGVLQLVDELPPSEAKGQGPAPRVGNRMCARASMRFHNGLIAHTSEPSSARLLLGSVSSASYLGMHPPLHVAAKVTPTRSLRTPLRRRSPVEFLFGGSGTVGRVVPPASVRTSWGQTASSTLRRRSTDVAHVRAVRPPSSSQLCSSPLYHSWAVVPPRISECCRWPCLCPSIPFVSCRVELVVFRFHADEAFVSCFDAIATKPQSVIASFHIMRGPLGNREASARLPSSFDSVVGRLAMTMQL